MNVFNQYHDDELNFHNQYRIYFSQCSSEYKLNLSELLRMLSDTAVEDYRARGISWSFLAERNIAILLSRQALRFHRIPAIDNLITITTWEEKSQPFQLMRYYEITDTNSGELLISGCAAWIIVNFKTHKIIKTKDFSLRPEPNRMGIHNCMEPAKILMPKDIVFLTERTVLYSDIDMNGHMNNSRYGAFVIDCIPEEYRKKEFTDFRINYSKEAALGGLLKIYGHFDKDSHKIFICAKQNENICFESELYYK